MAERARIEGRQKREFEMVRREGGREGRRRRRFRGGERRREGAAASLASFPI